MKDVCDLKRNQNTELIISKELESIIKNLPTNKSINGFTGVFYQKLGELIPVLKLFPKTGRGKSTS